MELSTFADRSIIVKLRVSKFTPYKRDKAATQVVERAAGKSRVGNFNKRLLDGCAAYDHTVEAFNGVYTYWFKNTVPWLDEEGARLLDSRNTLEFLSELRNRRDAAYAQLRTLEQQWPAIITADMARLGTLANRDDYPDDIASKFSVDWALRPVANVHDFRCELPEDELVKIQNVAAEAEARAKQYTIETLLEPVAHAAKRLAEYTGEKGQRWHDSVITNIKEVADQAKKLNIMDDPQITQLIREIDSAVLAAAFNPTMIKENPVAKDNLQARMDEIARKMGAFMTVRP